MSDRTSVYLTIRKADQARAEAVFEEHGCEFDESDESSTSAATIEYSFFEVDEANLEIESVLQKIKIPYTKRWDAGRDYGAGSEVFRIDADGNAIIKRFEPNEEGMVALEDVIKAFEFNRVDKFIEEMKNEVCALSWEEQEEILLHQ